LNTPAYGSGQKITQLIFLHINHRPVNLLKGHFKEFFLKSPCLGFSGRCVDTYFKLNKLYIIFFLITIQTNRLLLNQMKNNSTDEIVLKQGILTDIDTK